MWGAASVEHTYVAHVLENGWQDNINNLVGLVFRARYDVLLVRTHNKSFAYGPPALLITGIGHLC